MSYMIIIPARYDSKRLSAKLLAKVADIPLIQHVFMQAKKANASKVIIATDHEHIREVAEGFSAQVCMTSKQHNSGTERIAEVVSKLKLNDDEIIINIQGDQPLVPVEVIEQVSNHLLHDAGKEFVSICQEISQEKDLFDPNVVKVIMNANAEAIYFSRSAIPWVRDKLKDKDIIKIKHYKHIGIYGYRVGFLKKYINLSVAPIEKMESLEQLRAIWHGERIHMLVTDQKVVNSIDTAEQLNNFKKEFNSMHEYTVEV